MDDTGGGTSPIVDSAERSADFAERSAAPALDDSPVPLDSSGLAQVSEDQEGQEGQVADPAWRLTAWLLPLGAALSAVLTLAQTVSGGMDAPGGYLIALFLALLAALLLRDARRRAASGRWVRDEIHEYALPVGVLLATLVLLVRGADILTYLPALAALLPVAWGFVTAPHVERVRRLLPHALPVLNSDAEEPGAGAGEQGDAADEVAEAVQAVLERLPPEIAARLTPWDVAVQEELRPSPRGEVVFGCCFAAAHVIAIYRRPHLRYYRRGAELRQAVTYTVLHEIAHALGLDEEGVRRLGWLSDTGALIDLVARSSRSGGQ